MSHQTFPKPTPRVLEKAAKRKAIEQQRRAAYRLVDERDGLKCRCCKRQCHRFMGLSWNRLEHHHLLPRSLGGKDDTGNLVSLCFWCHYLVTMHALEIKGNADEHLMFERNGSVWHG